MNCSSCGADVVPDARFCTRCGARVQPAAGPDVSPDPTGVPSASDLAARAQAAREEAARRAAGLTDDGADTGVDAPAADATAATAAVAATPAEPSGPPTPDPPTPDPAPTALTETIPVPGLPTNRSHHLPPAGAAPAGTAYGQGGSDPLEGWDRSREPWRDEPRRSATFTPGRVAAMVATFVALTVLGTWALSSLFGSNAPDPDSAAKPPATSSSNPGSTQPSPSAPETSASVEPSPTESEASPSPSPTSTELPKKAKRCSTKGADAVATAWSGNRDTSCAFSNAVRTAYREADAATTGETFRTYSPVTKRWYDVTCGTGPYVRCQSADGAAVVFLGP